MKLIVGLGNPGKEYKKTRHNIGFMVLDKLSSAHASTWSRSKKEQLEYSKFSIKDTEIELIKPMAFMNNSGGPVARPLRKHKGEVEQVLLVHDDLDLDLGRLKIQLGGGPAGHHGVESIKTVISKKDKYDVSWDQVVRFRLGIGRPSINNQTSKLPNNQAIKSSSDYKRAATETGAFCAYQGLKSYVLTKFTQNQQETANHLIQTCVQAIETALQSGVEQAMNEFNKNS